MSSPTAALAERSDEPVAPARCAKQTRCARATCASLAAGSATPLQTAIGDHAITLVQTDATTITGTVVIGSQVKVMPAAVTHGSLTVSITESIDVSQPNEFSRGGQTVVTPQSSVSVTAEGNRMFKFEGGTTLDEIVRAVNEVGAAPGDLIAILEALKQAGALRAELEVI